MKPIFKKVSARGLSLLLPVLIIGVTGISVFLFLSSSISVSLSEILFKQGALQVRENLWGCLDEYLVHLPSNPEFNPTSLSLLNTTCSSVVTTTVSGQKQIVLSLTSNNTTRQMSVLVQLSPLTILEVSEP